MATDQKPNRGLLQLGFLLVTLVIVFSVFFLTPSLRPASLLSVLTALLLSPVIGLLERQKVPRFLAILVVFLFFGSAVVIAMGYASRVLANEWQTILLLLPKLSTQASEKLHLVHAWIQTKIGFQFPAGITEWMGSFGSETQEWLITHFPEFLGSFASAIFLVPIFSYFILRDGKTIFEQWLSLVPPEHSETTRSVLRKISVSLSEFIRAKTIEAGLVGLMTLAGLMIVGAPYAAVFAIIAGITNIVPYAGPILGAIPALAVFGFSESLELFFWPSMAVFVVVNLVDMAVIFPIFVAKLVNLSPLILLAAVAVGQQFYGLIGMLIAVPMAAILKIIYDEVATILYSNQTLGR